MYFRHKSLLAIAVVTALSLDNALAVWPEISILPVPAHTQEVKKENRRIAGAEFQFTYYTSIQEPNEIKDFYRLRLASLGWKEKTPLKDLEQIPGIQLEPNLTRAWEQNLMFEKDGTLLIITFLPEGTFPDKQTRFTIARGKIDLQSQAAGDKDFTPQLLAKPRKDVAPVYPGASLLSLSEPGHGLRAIYSTKDDINTVARFYKAQMPAYGWSLIEEQGVEKINVSDDARYDIAKLCPSCAKQALASLKNIEAWLGQLSFSNQRGDICNVVLYGVVPKEETPGSFEMNTILVNYEEKKK